MEDEGNGLAYLMNCFPSLTTTFVYREVRGVRRSGQGISLFSMHRPVDSDLSPESRSFLTETRYLLPAPVLELINSHFHYLLRRPLVYLRLLFTALSLSGGIRGARRSVLHWGLAAYAARVMERQRTRHIHAHFANNAASVAFFASRLIGASFSFTAHAFDLFADPLLLGEKVRAAAFVVAISEYNRRFLEEYVPEEAERVKVVHCGIDPREYSAPGRMGSIRRPEILSIGQLVEKKGFPYLLGALKRLAEKGTPFHCTILGDGYEKEKLARMVEAYGLQNRVQLAGPVYQDVARSYLFVADIFVLPCVVAANGDRDGIPVALMEAMAAGLPVVSTAVSGIPELIHHGDTGFLVPPRDEEALAEALEELLADQELRERLGARGRDKVVREFNLEKSALQLRDLFGECLGLSEGARSDEPRPVHLADREWWLG